MDVEGTDGEGVHWVHLNRDRDIRRPIVTAAINCKYSGSIKLFGQLRKYQLLKKYSAPGSQLVNQLLFYVRRSVSQLLCCFQSNSQLISQLVTFFCLSVSQLLFSFHSNSQSVNQSVIYFLLFVSQIFSQSVCQSASHSVSQLVNQSVRQTVIQSVSSTADLQFQFIPLFKKQSKKNPFL